MSATTSKKKTISYFDSPFIYFMKEWGIFLFIIITILITRIFLWTLVTVDGHSMDPTLAGHQRLFVAKTAKIDRFDIVVAKETENGRSKQIVKRIIGMPGDTITYDHDKLTVNGKKVNEDYLKSYQTKFAQDKLQSTYSYNSYFQQLARSAQAFTVDKEGNASFTVKVPKGSYLLLGDDRIVSKDSRAVGTFKEDSIIGEVKFRFWPLTEIGSPE
ncbi:signal peptidase I [Streptococcus criceti]|uniref:Signal peptidase I n=1 Tax=Streptococcus criceti HS-6 TaxID=873449 RepID=G5JRU0_STRCG|nr:signal peptidase I [Streptococcus criceti]EHI75392.1 signal peptidase I family protein [Streptococcus criceti HS-6]SUN43672.1 signal peptidase I [Streptococcus criceti]